MDGPQCRHSAAGSPPYGRDPAEGGLASYHQDHLVSSFGLAALGAADWAASGPAWRPCGEREDSVESGGGHGRHGVAGGGRTGCEEGEPERSHRCLLPVVRFPHRHGMRGRWGRASPKGVPIRWNLWRRGLLARSAACGPAMGRGGVWLAGYRPVVGRGAGVASHGAGRRLCPPATRRQVRDGG
jgi:hypothetical protein